MKKSVFFALIISLIAVGNINAQGGLLKKVGKAMTDELLGKPQAKSSTSSQPAQPEPQCACNQPEVVIDLGGKIQIDYNEMSIDVLDDGSILLKHRYMDEYYIAKDGVTQGPLKSGDPRIAQYTGQDNAENYDAFIARNKPYISKSGDKLLITFDGKTYGPYAQINNFTVSKSKDKFAALCIENIVVTDAQGKKMDEAIKNAKTEQEKMDLAIAYSQQIQQKMMQGGVNSSVPQLVTNIPDAAYSPLSTGGTFSNNIKFDDILYTAYTSIGDLKGKKLFTLKQDEIGAQDYFVSSDNSKYAVYNFGSLTISDNSKYSELFNPYLKKVDGKVYLTYMYYSPKKNAILQCKIPF